MKSKLIVYLSIIGFLLLLELSWWVIFVHKTTDEHEHISLSQVEQIKHLANQHYLSSDNQANVKFTILSEHPQLYFNDTFFDIDPQYIAHVRHLGYRNRRMFLYESIVFFIVLSFGFLRIYKSIQREFDIGQQQHNFMLSITHELKTPLSSIKLFLQTLLSRKNLDEEKRAKFLNNSVSEVDRLNTLIENILHSVKLERNPDVVQKMPYLLAPTITQALSKFNLHDSISLQPNLDEKIKHNIHPDMVTIIINNLVGNAIKYNKIINISVELKQKKQFIYLSVSDNGVGIPTHERGKVFDRFYRVGNEETRNVTGTGLGLYIVKKIVLACNGQIDCLENKPNGTLFLIKLPILKDLK